jgi:hypothetical protein
MSFASRAARLLVVAVLCTPAFAADGPVPVAGAGLADLWRGHFSGGRDLAPGANKIALDWADDVQFFPDGPSCRRWLRDMHAAYRTYEGFHGCLRIR